jgi:hypothetical protein
MQTRQDILTMDWQLAPAQSPARPGHQPVYEAKRPLPRGLIPHINRLVSSDGLVVDPTSVEVLDQVGNVYLCALVRVNAPDPVLPIVGLHWPPGVIESAHPMACKLRLAYQRLVFLLENPGRDEWRGGMARTINNLLSVLSAASQGVTDAEYAYVERHLIGAMREPLRYTRQRK